MNCPSELDFNRRLTQNEDRAKSNTRRIEKLEELTNAISDLATSVKVMAEKQDRVADAVDKLDGKVSVLEAKPGKRWDDVVSKIVLVFVTAVVTFVLSHVGFPV